jgi:internalin A
MKPNKPLKSSQARIKHALNGALKTHVLSLKRFNLNTIPPEVFEQVHLQKLVIARNKIETLPPELSKLKDLRSLNLSANNISILPPELGQLVELRHLDLESNCLAEVPPELGQLVKLTYLDLGSNRLKDLPSEIGKLIKLEQLFLYQNLLVSLPAEIGRLTNLRKLGLSSNNLMSLPPEIGRLKNLSELRLNGTQLRSLPKEIGTLVALRRLDLRRNSLETLPSELGNLEELQQLDLTANPVNTLPTELGRCSKLKRLILSGSALRFPPTDIAELGSKAILRYLSAADSASEIVWESKLLLVGEGAVGKTWLYEALNGRMSGGSRKEDGATIGIEIGPLDLPHPKSSEVMRLNCWDFAGQDINHATHQFFFSERSLFVLCWNARAGWEAGKLRKWLTNIRDRAPKAKVLLVATHADEPHSDYPEKELRAEFDQIAEVFKISSKTGEGVEDLKREIGRCAARLPMMGLRWPRTWRAAQQSVKRLRATVPYSSLNDVLNTILSSGLTKEDAAVLLRWLHELGEVLHYAEVPELAELVMLDPQWVTLHVGQVLASSEVQKAKGILTKSCVEEIWPHIDDHVRRHLLGMMERFDLAYRIPEDQEHRCLVVERLPQNPPDYEQKWQEAAGTAEVRLRYRLKSLHPGIPTWFIARCHRFTLGLHWLRGVLFGDRRHKPRHLALITANEGERTVDFVVRGPQPWSFLPILTDGFEDTILKRYPGLEFERIAPCTGRKKDKTPCDYEFNIKDLEALRWPNERGVESHNHIHCLRCRTQHEIDKLLLGLSRASGRDEGKLNEILFAVHAEASATRTFISAEMEEARSFIQLSFVQEWNRAQELEEQSCPTVFALYPLNEKTLTKKNTLFLQLYCMNPKCWHSIGPDGGCEIQTLREGVVTLAKWSQRALRWLKPVAALLPSGAQLAGEYSDAVSQFSKSAENELKLTADMFAQISAKGETKFNEVPFGDLDFNPRNRASDIDLYELKSLLDGLDFPIKPYGGLRRVRTPEGHILWLCAEHAQAFVKSTDIAGQYRLTI